MLPLITYLALTIPGVDGGTENIKAPGSVPTGGLANNGTGSRVIFNSITWLLVIISVLSLFFLVFGGIKWIMSGGDKSKIDSARKTIIYAIVGLIIALLSFFIVRVVGGLFGVDPLSAS